MRLLILFCLYEHFACLKEDARHSKETVGISANGDVSLMRAEVREPTKPLCNKLWDGKTVYGQDGGMQCVVTPLAPHWAWGGGAPPNMCLRPYADFMSDIVRQLKRWPDCAALAYLWTKLPDSHVAKHSSPFAPCGRSGVKRLFVDIGANIGSCTMQMLSRPDVAEVVAFEPDRKNLFYLTGGVLKNQGYGSKLKLFPMALGNSDGPHQMFVTAGGKTVMHAATVANPVLPLHSVKTETSTLDEVFLAGSHQAPYIHVMKIHSQGLEVKILEGGRQLLESGAINAIHFELAPMWLLSAGSTPAELFTILRPTDTIATTVLKISLRLQTCRPHFPTTSWSISLAWKMMFLPVASLPSTVQSRPKKPISHRSGPSNVLMNIQPRASTLSMEQPHRQTGRWRTALIHGAVGLDREWS